MNNELTKRITEAADAIVRVLQYYDGYAGLKSLSEFANGMRDACDFYAAEKWGTLDDPEAVSQAGREIVIALVPQPSEAWWQENRRRGVRV